MKLDRTQLRRRRWQAIALAGGFALTFGCHRADYRLRADREARKIVDETSNDPRWQLCDIDAYGDPRSRYYSVYDPDRPPMPPDDPASNRYMQCVHGMRGPKEWDKAEKLDDLINPDWETCLPSYATIDEDGAVVLDLESAVRIARINSPSYQENLEEVYLAALDVAFERFRFDVQFFGGNTTGMFARGDEPRANIGATGPGVGASSSVLSTESAIGVNRQFAAGGQLLASFANSMVWQFAGTDTNFATSLLNFSLVQPLLRGGGRALNLERLTRVERNLLGNLRAQAQFRQEFYMNIAVGDGIGIEPRRIGGFEGGSGLTGFTGTGQGGFGGVGAGQGFGGFGGGGGVGGSGAGAGTGLAGGGEGLVGGFYGLVQRLQVIRNTEVSLATQLNSLGLLQSNFEAGLIDLIQVDQFRQNIETERSSLLQSRVAFQDQVESYLRDLGLPPWVPIKLDDSIAKPYEFVDADLTATQPRVTALNQRIGDLPIPPNPVDLDAIRLELTKLLGYAAEKSNTTSVEFERFRTSIVPPEDSERPDEADRELDIKQVDIMRQTLTNLNRQIDDDTELVSRTKSGQTGVEQINTLAGIARRLSSELQGLALIQARTRLEGVELAPIPLSEDLEEAYQQAYEIARNNRLDWMNRRAALVDQWRLIEFNANRLESNLDIVLDGDLGTLGDNPVKFRSPTGSVRARLVFDAPLNRKSERNVYRESLIEYQRSKRSYIRYVDGVALSLRSRLRQIDRLGKNLAIQKEGMKIAIRRVDFALDQLNEPLTPPAPGEPPAQLGETVSQNLLSALSDLRNTQDNLLSVAFNYESTRMSLTFDLGLMQIDDNQMWVDEQAEPSMASLDHDRTDALPDEQSPLLNALHESGLSIEDESVEIDGADGFVEPIASVIDEPARSEFAETSQASAETLESEILIGESDAKPARRRGFTGWLRQIGSFGSRRPEAGETASTSDQTTPAETQHGNPFLKRQFVTNLLRCKSLRDRGFGDAELAEETGWSEAEVHAYDTALESIGAEVAKPVLIQQATTREPATE